MQILFWSVNAINQWNCLLHHQLHLISNLDICLIFLLPSLTLQSTNRELLQLSLKHLTSAIIEKKLDYILKIQFYIPVVHFVYYIPIQPQKHIMAILVILISEINEAGVLVIIKVFDSIEKVIHLSVTNIKLLFSIMIPTGNLQHSSPPQNDLSKIYNNRRM